MERYSVLCCLQLRRHAFYLFTNFIDIIYNNFSVSIEEGLSPLEYFLRSSINILNRLLISLAVLAFLQFSFTLRYNHIHRTYALVRLGVCGARLVLYAASVICQTREGIVAALCSQSFLLFFFEVGNFSSARQLCGIVEGDYGQQLRFGSDSPAVSADELLKLS